MINRLRRSRDRIEAALAWTLALSFFIRSSRLCTLPSVYPISLKTPEKLTALYLLSLVRVRKHVPPQTLITKVR